jgi:hypothetical protein
MRKHRNNGDYSADVGAARLDDQYVATGAYPPVLVLQEPEFSGWFDRLQISLRRMPQIEAAGYKQK